MSQLMGILRLVSYFDQCRRDSAKVTDKVDPNINIMMKEPWKFGIEVELFVSAAQRRGTANCSTRRAAYLSRPDTTRGSCKLLVSSA
jgi:hypothetical protein